MNITIKKDEATGEYYIDLNDLAELFDDISVVEYYTIDEKDDGSLALEFFDKDDKKVEPKSK